MPDLHRMRASRARDRRSAYIEVEPLEIDVVSVHALSIEDFRRRHAHGGMPVVLSDGIEQWPARRSWSLDYFARRFSKKELRFSGGTWRLGEFLERLRDGSRPAPYLKEVKLDEQFPELKADLGDFKYARPNLLDSPWLPKSMRIPNGHKALFIGAAGSGFGKLHWDHSCLHVFISQIVGDKDVVLYAPAESDNLYPDPQAPNKSLIVDFNDFDAAEFPRVASASPVRVTIRGGQTLFIPAGWWHATAMHDVSISVAESTLDEGNWRQRSDWFLAQYRRSKVPIYRRALLSAYMRGVEALLR